MYLTDRIELIGGKIVAAGYAEGAFQLLKILLESWTAHAALGFVAGDFQPWIAAICSHYQKTADQIERMIAADPSEPLPSRLSITQIFPDEWKSLRCLLRNLLLSANQSNLRFVNGPGFAIRIGEDAPTPDFIIAQGHAGFRVAERHIEGIPEIAVETADPCKNLRQLLQLYAAHGIPEVWVIDLKWRNFNVLQNRGGYYHHASLLTDGIYHSVAVGGLVINIDRLWDLDMSPEQMLGLVLLDETGEKPNSIINYSRIPDYRTKPEKKAVVRPGQIPFEPRIGYDPDPLTFEEFIAWTPETEFRIEDNRLVIASRTGTRNMIGMLLQSIGLKKAVAALPLSDWITAIAERRLQIASRRHILKCLAREVQRTGKILREEFGRHELRTFGWLDQPPGIWTSIKIVDMLPENGGPSHREIRRSLREQCDETIEFVGFDALTPGDRLLFEKRCLKI